MHALPDDRRPPQGREGPALLLVRLALAAVGMVVLWVAARRWFDVVQLARTEFQPPRIAQQLLVVALGAVAGLLLGLATVLPRPPWRYGTGRALVTALPPALFVVVIVLSFTRHFDVLPGWTLVLLELFGLQSLVFGAALLGVALAAGFSASGRERPGQPPLRDAT